MKRANIAAKVAILALPAALAGAALAAQDRYSLQVPDGLAFSEFRGYEDWQTVAVSQNGKTIETILGNPAMIEAYKAGIPGNGKPFPDGARMARSIGPRRRLTTSPASRWCRAPCMTWTSWRRTARGSQTAADGDLPSSSMTSRPIRSGPATHRTVRRRSTTPSAGSRATRSSRRKTTFSRPTRSGDRAAAFGSSVGLLRNVQKKRFGQEPEFREIREELTQLILVVSEKYKPLE